MYRDRVMQYVQSPDNDVTPPSGENGKFCVDIKVVIRSPNEGPELPLYEPAI